MPPKVSVNICCYNGEKYLKQTIDSVLGQTFSDLEVIIVDDGSKDDTQKIVRSYQDGRIKYFYQENHGLSYSRNKAFSCSQGKYAAIVDQDDIWYPEKLERQVGVLESDPEVGLVYTDANYIDDQGRITGKYFDHFVPQRGAVAKGLLAHNFIPCPTVLLRSDDLKKIGLFRLDLNIAEEYELFLRLSLISRFEYVNAPLAGYRVHENNTSRNIREMCREEILILTDFMKGPIEKELAAEAGRQLRRRKVVAAAYYLCNANKEYGRAAVAEQISAVEQPVIRNAFYALAYLPVSVIRPIITGAYYLNRVVRRINASLLKEKENENAVEK